jgi:hypothetical protein
VSDDDWAGAFIGRGPPFVKANGTAFGLTGAERLVL